MSVYPNGRPTTTDPAASDLDRRTAERFRILQRCLVRPAASPGSASWKGIAYDLSYRGIGLALPYPITIGTELVVDPVGLPHARPMHVRVVRFHPVSYLWFCGCELDRSLLTEEIKTWLRAPATPQQLPDTLPDLALR